MPTPQMPPEENYDSNPNTSQGGASATIDAPLLDNGKLKTEDRSVRSVKHAMDICTATEVANKRRSMRASQMQLVYDGEPPRNSQDKAAKAQSWQANFNSGWLAGIVDIAVLRMVKAITQQIYLTKSTLPSSYVDFKNKSDLFQSKATKLFRQWPGLQAINNDMSKEVGLHGYGFAVWLDPRDWKPTFYKQEACYVPEQSSTEPDKLQFIVIRQDYLLHEFIELFNDKEKEAKDAGYELDNCLEAANKAPVKNPRDEVLTTQYRNFSEMITDGTLGLTYTVAGTRIVKTYLLLNREYDGKVSLWMLNRDDGKLLRYSNKAYDKMSQVVIPFTLEAGNGHIHSSKGLGRKLINLAVAIETGRNNALDAARMGSMMILKVPTKDRAKFQPVISSPFIVLPAEIQESANKMGINGDEFLKLDMQMTSWAAQSSGAYISSNLDPSGQSKRTATEASIDAQREQESTDMVRSGYVDQFASMITQMQARAFSDDNLKEAQRVFDEIAAGTEETEEMYDKFDDKETTRTIVEMLKFGLTTDEIKLLRSTPASGIAHVEDAVTSEGITKVAALYSNNPKVDQDELLKRNIEAMAGPEAAKSLVIPGIDQTVEAEASRMQQFEAATMLQLGQPVSVSPRDNHLVHATTLKALLEATIPTLSQNPAVPQQLMKSISLGINHLADHIEMATLAGNKSPDLDAIGKWLTQFTADYKKVIEVQEQAKVTEQAAAAAGAAANAAVQSGATPPPAATAAQAPVATPPVQ